MIIKLFKAAKDIFVVLLILLMGYLFFSGSIPSA